jgi:hypothetical protein
MAGAPKPLAAVYLATTYVVFGPEGTLSLRIGQRHPKLDLLLWRYKAPRWAFLTGFNPRSIRLAGWRNRARQRQLERLIGLKGYSVFAAAGVGDDPAWLPESSVLVLGIAPGRAARLAGLFGQNAIVVGRRGRPAELVWC